MYGLAGERRLTEWEVPWLSGLRGVATRSRVGNAAHGQLQLDVYGEVLDAMYQARQAGLAPLDDGWRVGPQGHRVAGAELGPTGRWNLGGPRPAAALRPFESHGLGGRATVP